jgi:hypothetical protein
MGNHTLSACHPCNANPILCFRRENKNDFLDLMNYCSRLPLVRTGDLFFPTIFLFNIGKCVFPIVNWWTTFAKFWGNLSPFFILQFLFKKKESKPWEG